MIPSLVADSLVVGKEVVDADSVGVGSAVEVMVVSVVTDKHRSQRKKRMKRLMCLTSGNCEMKIRRTDSRRPLI